MNFLDPRALRVKPLENFPRHYPLDGLSLQADAKLTPFSHSHKLFFYLFLLPPWWDS